MRKIINKLVGTFGYRIVRISPLLAWLEKDYPDRADFSLVQVGAHDGVSHDFLYDFANSRKLTGLLIEPQPELFAELRKNYANHPGIVCANFAVHPTLPHIRLHRVKPQSIHRYPRWANGIGSLDIDHLRKTNKVPAEDIESIDVEARPLMSLIDEHGIRDIDYLQIDTEGFDLEVLKMFDFDRLRPRYVRLEVQSLSASDKMSAKSILDRHGYLVSIHGMDMVGRLKRRPARRIEPGSKAISAGA